MFVLLGRDRHAPVLVRLWAELRGLEGENPEKVREAASCALAMERWRTEHLGKPPYSIDVSAMRVLVAVTQENDLLRRRHQELLDHISGLVKKLRECKNGGQGLEDDAHEQ